MDKRKKRLKWIDILDEAIGEKSTQQTERMRRDLRSGNNARRRPKGQRKSK